MITIPWRIQYGNRPNVIFVLTDDQGPWAAGCCGNDEVRTPYLDQMASEGTRFPNFSAQVPSARQHVRVS